MTNILAIETSCDETSASVIAVTSKGVSPLSNVVASQIKIHQKTQGVVPEVAARAHIKKISPVVRAALAKAGKDLANIDVLAVTYGPGLISSLLVGVEFAKALALSTKKPIVPVNHMLGHLYSSSVADPKLKMPSINLIVSGGHTYIVLLKSKNDYRILGRTIDDAAGEAFDKVAKMLKLPYPGGPQISKYAARGKVDYGFPRPMLNTKSFDFSFSGLKTAVLYYIKNNRLDVRDEQIKANIAYSFQNAAIDVLVKKTIRAAEKYSAKSVTLSGGVAANKTLRNILEKECTKRKIKFYVPELLLCTDNALMIANAAAIMLQGDYKPRSATAIKVDPGLEL